MYKKEFVQIVFFTAVVFAVVAGAGWFAVHQLQQNSLLLAIDTLPGLLDVSAAEMRANENWQTMGRLLKTHNSAEQAQLIREVTRNQSDTAWQNYEANIYDNADRQSFQAMMILRSNYFQVREQFFDLVTAGKFDEASGLFRGDLSRGFNAYHATVKKLFSYNAQLGQTRGDAILKSAKYAPWVIAGLCVLVFVLGWILGVRFAIGAGGARPHPAPHSHAQVPLK
jgi:hypothetical protein